MPSPDPDGTGLAITAISTVAASPHHVIELADARRRVFRTQASEPIADYPAETGFAQQGSLTSSREV